MRAVLCKKLEGPKGLFIEDIPKSQPQMGEISVLVRYVALNFFDTLIIRGKYQVKPELPFSLGGEISGVVESVGEGVKGFVKGDRLAAYLGWGGAREQVLIPLEKAIPIPQNVSDEIAASLSIVYGTALYGLKDRGAVREGQTVAVLGAAGGAGLAAVEVAKNLGASVIAVASSEEKLQTCRAHGADALLDYTKEDLKEGLRRLTSGEGVDVIYDCVGGSAAEPALRALKWDGRFLVVGFASGDIPKIPLNLLLVKGISVIGVFWGESVKRDPTGHAINMRKLLNWASEGKIKPLIHTVYPLEKVEDALGVLEGRSAIGKVLLKVS
ncbi:MAG: NADPH:quinone oxidoreductase family protein [Hyphomicrobium sp.]